MGGGGSTSFLSEREQVIGKLERGMYVTKFFSKRRPEKKLLAVRRETMLLVWSRVMPAGHSSSQLTGTYVRHYTLCVRGFLSFRFIQQVLVRATALPPAWAAGTPPRQPLPAAGGSTQGTHSTEP